jgi:hypothetical protein
MNLAVFVHVYAAGNWLIPLSEVLAPLADFEGDFNFGIIGSALQHTAVLDVVPDGDAVCVEQGSEEVTINFLRNHALEYDGAVLYAHTKGAAYPSTYSDRWRRAMIKHLIFPWRENLEKLEGYDVLGPFWMTGWPNEWSRFFGGNFWMATCSYLRTLPECVPENRYAAENWIGQNNPNVNSIFPGVPSDELFA